VSVGRRIGAAKAGAAAKRQKIDSDIPPELQLNKILKRISSQKLTIQKLH
jgi:hypothetical protein